MVQSVDSDLTDNGVIVLVLFLPSLCVQEMAEETAADLPPSPQSATPPSATPTLSVPSTGMVTHICYAHVHLRLNVFK